MSRLTSWIKNCFNYYVYGPEKEFPQKEPIVINEPTIPKIIITDAVEQPAKIVVNNTTPNQQPIDVCFHVGGHPAANISIILYGKHGVPFHYPIHERVKRTRKQNKQQRKPKQYAMKNKTLKMDCKWNQHF